MVINRYLHARINDKFVYSLLFIYTVILLFFNTKMSPLYPINDWADVNLYFTIGKGVFNGIVPYTEAFDHKGPLIFLIYGIGYLISNTSFWGVFLLLILVWYIGAILSYRMAHLFLSKGYALLVALASPILILSHTMEGGSAEEFIVFAILGSLYLFVKQFRRTSTNYNSKHLLVHGCLVSIVFLIKLNLIVFWIVPLAIIFLDLLLNKNYKLL